MKILGIDTSSMAASVAVIEDNKLICEYTINTKKTHSKTYADDRKHAKFK